jgi:Fimbrial assembly protein (PilN)
LTVQKQLEAIPTLETQSPTTSRLFGYIAQLTPVNATISTLNISFTAGTVTLTGGADSLATVNTYVDTIKDATYNNLTAKTKNNKAFSSVVLSTFSYASTASPPAQFSITFNFDPALFNSADNVSLVVPSETATLSILNQPTVFKANSPAAQ